ncbi:MAG: hypothetical protein PQJ46_14220 [Spirochaetales bacterium]|nr:hypothetical protein [Spirochaetales bacterium]
MKKRLIPSLLLLFIFPCFTVAAGDLDLGLDLDFTVANENMSDTLTTEDIPGVTINSTFLSTLLNVDIGGYLSDKAEIDRAYLSGDITSNEKDDLLEKAAKWRFSSSINLAAALLDDESSIDDDDSNENYYDILQTMIDWYENNRFEFGLPKLVWPTTEYGSETGQTQFITGSTVTDIEDVEWTEAIWYDARLLYDEVKKMIELRINAISSDIDIQANDDLPDQFNLSGDALTLAKLEKRAWEEYQAYVFGASTSTAIEDVLYNTKLEFTNIAGIFDFCFSWQTNYLSVGDMIESNRAAQDEKGLGASVSITDAIIPGLTGGLRFQMSGGQSTIAEDWSTLSSEEYDGEASDKGILFNTQYAFKNNFKYSELNTLIGFEGGVLDIMHPINSAGSLTLNTTLNVPMQPHFIRRYNGNASFDLNLDAEGNILGYDDEYQEGEEALGYAAGGLLTLDYCGIQPSVYFRWKSEEYGGDDYGNCVEDRFTERSLDDDFDNTSLSSAMALEYGLTLDMMKIFNRELAIYFKMQNMLTDDKRAGWRAGLNFNFGKSDIFRDFNCTNFFDLILAKAMSLPISGDVEVGVYGDHPITGLVRLVYTPVEAISFIGRVEAYNDSYDNRVWGASISTRLSY